MNAPSPFPLETVARASLAVAGTSARTEKVTHLASCLQAAPERAIPIVVAWLSGELRQGRIGVGPAAIAGAREAAPAAGPSLGVEEVDRILDEIARIRGTGSTARRVAALRALFSRATAVEQRFLAGLLFGELRQGALSGVMAEAIARAASMPLKQVRRALMVSDDAGAVARTALGHGAGDLAAFGLQLLRPVQPMLAGTAEGVDDALERLGRATLEYKLDGARIQAHRVGTEVRVFSRRMNEVTASVPEVVEAVRALPSQRLVLDGEAIALRPDGSPLPFQVTMQRFGRRLDVEGARTGVPLSCFFFDCLHADGRTLLGRPLAERLEVLTACVPADLRVPGIVTAEVGEGTEFLERALAAGHEGLVAKGLESEYEAGSRGGAWLKIKQAHTLDLVVLAAEWGSGRRRGWLSNLHLGARDPGTGGFVMLGKTFKGMTDRILEWQTGELLARERGREGHVVHVRPELVVEIAFDGVQRSRRYPGGLALRFARLKAYRPDKAPEQADTIDTVQALQTGP